MVRGHQSLERRKISLSNERQALKAGGFSRGVDAPFQSDGRVDSRENVVRGAQRFSASLRPAAYASNTRLISSRTLRNT
jgi:hypothetical protein